MPDAYGGPAWNAAGPPGSTPLHKDMFGAVWRWAGTYRRREATIGIDPVRVSTSVRDLMEDARLWVDGEQPMPPDEAGCRLHHRLPLLRFVKS